MTRFVPCRPTVSGRALLLALPFTLLVLGGVPVSAGILVVNTTSDSNQNDSLCSVREALAAAAGDLDPYQGCTGAIGDDTILIPAGLYAVNGTLAVVTNGQNVNLTGLSATGVHFAFALSTNLLDVQAGTGAGRVTLLNLDLDGGRTGVRLLDNTRLVVDSTTIRNATAFGIDVQQTVAAAPPAQPQVRIVDSMIDEIGDPGPLAAGTGVRVQAGPGNGQQVEIVDTTISSCEVQGVSIAGETDLTIQGSTIVDNGDTTIGGAVGAGVGQSAGDLEITGTVVSGNRGVVGGLDYSDGFGIVSLTDVDFYANVGATGGGARILTSLGSVERVLLEENLCTGLGCGLSINDGIVGVSDTVLLRNKASGEAGNGGGLAVNGGEVSLTRVAVVQNTAGDRGGGIYKFASDTLTMTNVTIADNQADGSGGGLYVDTGSVTVSSVTLAYNVADADEDGSGEGGGLAIDAGASATLFNTLLGGNRNADPVFDTADDCAGSLTSSGYNLITTTTGCSLTGSSVGNHIGVAPELGDLRAVTGAVSTWIRPPLPGSPAVDSGTPTGCPATDQRGIPRPVDGDDDTVASCDIGAVELGANEIFSSGFESGGLSGWSLVR